MFIVTIEQAQDDDFFGHWILCGAYILNGPGATQAKHEALYRWINASYYNSNHPRREFLRESGGGDKVLRVTVCYGVAPGSLRQVHQDQFVPLDHWVGGRHTNAVPVHCPGCNWYGAMKHTVHGYTLTSMGEVEPLDRCPRCRANLP